MKPGRFSFLPSKARSSLQQARSRHWWGKILHINNLSRDDFEKKCLQFYWPVQKLRNLGSLGNLGIFLNPSFRFWLQCKIENSEMRKLRTLFPRFPRFRSFRFATFSFLISFILLCMFFWKSLPYICKYSSTLYFSNIVQQYH